MIVNTSKIIFDLSFRLSLGYSPSANIFQLFLLSGVAKGINTAKDSAILIGSTPLIFFIWFAATLKDFEVKSFVLE